jgi:rRNA maturation RNase YbeY
VQEIQFYQEDIPLLVVKEEEISRWINDLIANEKAVVGEISIIFCSDKYLLKINKQHLNHDYYTDIITFDYCIDDIISGDLFISLDRIYENAGQFKADYYNELFRIVFHGILHLVGYGDKKDGEKEIMTAREDYYLNKFDIKN